MRVKVKLVVFKTTESAPYCGYCPANDYYCREETTQRICKRVTDVLLIELQHRNKYPKHLEKFGWTITKDSIIPPSFTDEDLVKLTEESYGIKIVEPQIIELDVEAPEEKILF